MFDNRGKVIKSFYTLMDDRTRKALRAFVERYDDPTLCAERMFAYAQASQLEHVSLEACQQMVAEILSIIKSELN